MRLLAEASAKDEGVLAEDGTEQTMPASQLVTGSTIVVRPGKAEKPPTASCRPDSPRWTGR